MARVSIPKTVAKSSPQTNVESTIPFDLYDYDEDPWQEVEVLTPPHKSRPAAAMAARASLIKTPIPWTRSDPPLMLGKCGSFFNLSDTIHPMDIVHVAGFGGTGSGKSMSVALPFVKAAICYELNNKKKAAVFVLDPKKELLLHIRATLSQQGETDRLTIIGECPAIQLFTQSCALSAADRFRHLREFFPAADETGSGGYWRQQADAILTDLIELEMLYFEKTGQRFVYKLGDTLEIPNIEGKGFWSVVRSVLTYSCKSHANLQKTNATLQEIFDHLKIISSSLHFMAPFAGSKDLIEQWSYTVMTSQPMLSAFSDRSIEAFVDMDVIAEASKPRTQIESLIAQSKVVIFSPERSVASTAAGKALKQRFYEAVFSRDDLEMPIFMVLDEYQTFVSPSDTDLIDRCRAYRCMVVACSQSISSLKHALGNTIAAQNIVDILCTNLTSRFSLRSNDADTSAWLRTQLPIAPDGGPHVLDVRRLANLAPGEAYYMFASGTWGRDRASLTS